MRLSRFLWLLLMLATGCLHAQNLLDNPGFEQGTNFWTADGPAVFFSTNAAHSGLRSAFITRRTADSQGLSQPIAGRLETNVSYFVSCWVSVGAPYPQTVRLTFQGQTGSTNPPVELVERTINSSNWVYMSTNFTLFNDIDPATLILKLAGPAAGVNLSADDFVLMPLSGFRLAARNFGVRLGGISSDTTLKNDAVFAEVVAGEYHIAGAENALKFSDTEPSLNSYSFGAADTIVNTAMVAGENSRGHTLIWHGSVPTWITNVAYTPTQLQQIVFNHVDTVVGRYSQKLFCWDVVNEAFNDNGTLRSTVWYDQPGIGYAGQGTLYIEELYKRVRNEAPDTEIIYNDYNDETINAKSSAIYAMASDFKQRGVPLDGIGFQLHETLPGVNIASWRSSLSRFAQLGLKLHITEMDVRLPVNSAGVASAADLNSQADLYFNLIGTALAFPELEVVQTWGFSDKYSWIPSSYPGYGAGLPLDQNFNRKPAWWAIHDVLANQAELLPVVGISATAGQVILTNSLFSAGRARQLLANAKGDFIELGVNVPYNGKYDVRIGIQRNPSSGQFQVAASPLSVTNFVNVGLVSEGYAAAPTSAELDLGTNSFNTTGDYAFRFSIAGRNVSSSGYNLVLDYVRLTPTAAGNQAPFISALADQVFDSTRPQLFVPFAVYDRETVESALTVTFSSSNAVLLPNSRIRLFGGGQHRLLSILPIAGQTGSSQVVISVTDTDGASTTSQFTVRSAPPSSALTIGVAGGQLQLTWPTNGGPWNLQSSAALGLSALWQNVLITPTLQGQNWFVSIPEISSNVFFRLAQ